MAKIREQQSIQETLRLLHDQLVAMQEDADLLIRKLECQAGSPEHQCDACQTVIEQMQQIELALSRLVATFPDLLHDIATRHPDPTCAHLDERRNPFS